MSKVKEFNKQNIPDIRVRFKAALKELEQDLGINFNLGRITFTGTEMRGKLICSTTQVDLLNGNKAIDPEVAKYNQICGQYGLTPSDLYTPFYMNGKQLELIGARLGNTRYIFKVRGVSGGLYKMAAYQVLKAMNRSNAESFKPAPHYARSRVW